MNAGHEKAPEAQQRPGAQIEIPNEEISVRKVTRKLRKVNWMPAASRSMVKQVNQLRMELGEAVAMLNHQIRRNAEMRREVEGIKASLHIAGAAPAGMVA